MIKFKIVYLILFLDEIRFELTFLCWKLHNAMGWISLPCLSLFFILNSPFILLLFLCVNIVWWCRWVYLFIFYFYSMVVYINGRICLEFLLEWKTCFCYWIRGKGEKNERKEAIWSRNEKEKEKEKEIIDPIFCLCGNFGLVVRYISLSQLGRNYPDESYSYIKCFWPVSAGIFFVSSILASFFNINTVKLVLFEYGFP